MISNQEIRRQVAHEITYTKGIQYYHKGKVAQLRFDETAQCFHADVLGQQRYHVTVSFDGQKMIKSATCQCQAYANYRGACKHIVAVLKSIQMNWERHWKLDYRAIVPDLETVTQTLGRASKSEQVGGETFSSTLQSEQERRLQEQMSKVSTDKFYEAWEKVNETSSGPMEIALIPTLILGYDVNGHLYRRIEFNIRNQRLYLIKDLFEWLHELDAGRVVAMGKLFLLSFKDYRFDKDSELLYSFLLAHFRHERQLGGHLKRTLTETASFQGKHFILSDHSLKQFISIMKYQKFDICFESYLEKETYETHVIEENPNLSISVTQEDETMYLVLNETQKDLRPLDSEGQLLYFKGIIYITEPDFSKAMGPIVSQVSQLPSVKIAVDETRQNQFFSSILPKIERYAEVLVDNFLNEKILREPLEVEIYLDQWQSEIVADVVFKYGSIEVQPFSNKVLEAPLIESSNEVKLVRDILSESECLDWFFEAGFYRVEGGLRLTDPEAIGDFYYTKLEELLQIGTVFRTERFMNTTVKIPNPFKINCKMEQTTGLMEINFEGDGLTKEEMVAIVNAYRQKKRYLRLKNGDLIALHESEGLAELSGIVEHLGLKVSQMMQDVVELPAYRALYLEAAGRGRSQLRLERNQAFKQLIRQLEHPEDLEIEIPKPLNDIMRDYQKTGFKWLKMLSKYGFGGILADDMGLGKTLQVLSFIVSEQEEKLAKGLSSGRALIVVPTSLVYNWQAEIDKFAPQLTYKIILGTKSERIQGLSALEGVDVVITTYGLLKRDIDYYRKIDFEYCLIDEAQHIKNANTLSARSVKMIRAKTIFALTGTPIENGLTELWSIFDFVMPGYLYQNSQFINRYANPIIKEGDKEVMKHLRRHIQPFVLRRLKEEVLSELPEKIESKVFNQMTPEQEKQYLAWQMRAKKEFEDELSQNTGQPNKIKILALLTRLRQLAIYPGLFLENYAGGSGKLDQLLELMEDALSGGHRMLIFSQFTTLLGEVSKRLEEVGLESWYIDGSVSAEERINRVKAFNEGEKSIFLISLKAGGTGLNLTGADVVVHLDPWWNPAVEDQATDRVHRIGQTKVVQVFKMITKNTIEEKIEILKERKKNLMGELIHSGDQWIEGLGLSDIRSLFELKE